MTRTQHARPQHASPRSLNLDRTRAAHKKKKPYKIVLEAVTQYRKKLHFMESDASIAPTGFGFIPAGHPEFTEWCKEQCRQQNLDVYCVSAKPKNKVHTNPEKLSHHVHRIGFHFPLSIIRRACLKFGYTYSDAQGLKKVRSRYSGDWIAQSVKAYGSRQAPSTQKETKEYISGAVRDLFPKIPAEDLASIVNHAFEEGTNRVGNATELSLPRRVQLAVVAHIRHVYTEYDKLLKTSGWQEARSKVEHVSLARLKEWRDELDEPSDELEDTFREVIILDDDDDEDNYENASSEGDSLSTPDEREQVIEVECNLATERDLQPDLHFDYHRKDMRDMNRISSRTISAPRYQPPPPAPPPALMGPSRSQSMVGHPVRTNGTVHLASQPTRHGNESYRPTHPVPVVPYVRALGSQNGADGYNRINPTVPPPNPQNAPLMRDTAGRLYQLQPIEDTSYTPRPERSAHAPNSSRQPHNSFVYYPPPPSAYIHQSHSRRASDQDVVLPSVEPQTVHLASPRRFADRPRPFSDVAGSFPDLHSPKRKVPPFSSDDRDMFDEGITRRYRRVNRADDKALYPLPGADSTVFRESARPAQTSRSVIDLASSPYQPPSVGDRRDLALAQPRRLNDSDGHGYFPVPARPPPPHDMRGAYHEAPIIGARYGYMSPRGSQAHARTGYD